MNVAFIYDSGNQDGTKGGAELTMEGFAAACPSSVALTDVSEADTVVVGNCVTISPTIVPQLMGRKVIRYHHDLARNDPPSLRGWLNENAEHIFTSPLHREKAGMDGHLIPPAMDLDRFRPNRQTRRHPDREGIVTVGSWQNPGKGGVLLSDWLRREGLTADCYGHGPFVPAGPHILQHGEYDQTELPGILHRYETFAFTPFEPEPFGRCVVEAWAAGCELRINDLVGARHWIENDPGKLGTAGSDFWGLVCA